MKSVKVEVNKVKGKAKSMGIQDKQRKEEEDWSLGIVSRARNCHTCEDKEDRLWINKSNISVQDSLVFGLAIRPTRSPKSGEEVSLSLAKVKRP